MELFLLYIWMKLGALFVMLLVAAATFLFFAIVCLLQHEDYPTKGWWVLSKKWAVASATLAIISATIPTQNQVAVPRAREVNRRSKDCFFGSCKG